MKIEEQNTEVTLLARPVVLTITNADELEWVYRAFAAATHMRDVPTSSPQQRFYGDVHTQLKRHRRTVSRQDVDWRRHARVRKIRLLTGNPNGRMYGSSGSGTGTGTRHHGSHG